MNPRACAILSLVLLSSAAQARAESRSVLVLIRHTKDDKPQVTIRSDEEKERKAAASIDEACTVIKEMKGWGSIVHVFVVSERRLATGDFKKLIAAITDNAWLELTYFRQGRSKSFVDHYLKTQDVEQPASSAKLPLENGKPRLSLKTVSPPSGPERAQSLVFQGDGSGPIHRAGPEHFKLTRVSDGHTVSLFVEYDRETLDEQDRRRSEGTPRNPRERVPAARARYAYKHLFRRVRLFLDTAEHHDKKDEMEEGDALDLYARAKLEPGQRYRLTWACWPVGAAEAIEVSVDFALGEKKAPPSKATDDEPKQADELKQAFEEACKQVAALERTHSVLEGLSQVEAHVEQDAKGLKEAWLKFDRNTRREGKPPPPARDASRPHFYLAASLWRGAPSVQPPADTQHFRLRGDDYHLTVFVGGSDAKLVAQVRGIFQEAFLAWTGPQAPPARAAPGGRDVGADTGRIDVSSVWAYDGARIQSQRDRGDGTKVLHGLQVILGPKPNNQLTEYAIYNNGEFEGRQQFYANGLTFRDQHREPGGDGYEIVYTPEDSKVVIESIKAADGTEIGPIKTQDVICQGTVKGDRRWQGTFLVREAIPMPFPVESRWMLQEYRKGELVKSTPFPEEKLRLPKEHTAGWGWDSLQWPAPAERRAR